VLCDRLDGSLGPVESTGCDFAWPTPLLRTAALSVRLWAPLAVNDALTSSLPVIFAEFDAGAVFSCVPLRVPGVSPHVFASRDGARFA